ncbi:hypothetical protein [Cystobacter ferrugineus]|uniref:hypothetical protein n=1 Tax=Cystobacter ferrugineus TaxID=83449 RepID=UPI0016514FBB|nr:hypothetical protein [Cystobacter ferrugineus]
MKMGLIVEGHGEVHAVPLLVRRLLKESAPEVHPTILPPHRVARGHEVAKDENKEEID